MRISRIRLSDWLHRKAHGGGQQGTRSRRSTPRSPMDHVEEKRRVPRPCILCRLRKEIANAIVDMGVDASVGPRLRAIAEVVPTSRAVTCSACRALPATGRYCCGYQQLAHLCLEPLHALLGRACAQIPLAVSPCNSAGRTSSQGSRSAPSGHSLSEVLASLMVSPSLVITAFVHASASAA